MRPAGLLAHANLADLIGVLVLLELMGERVSIDVLSKVRRSRTMSEGRLTERQALPRSRSPERAL
jgi:hypothetical protein